MNPFKTLLFTILLMPLFSCTNHQIVEYPKQNTISDSILKNVQTATVQYESPGSIVKLNGKIEPDETMQSKVFALVSGKICSVKAELGDYVKKGQVLATIKSPEIAGFSNDVTLSEANVDMARKSMETAKELFDGKLATEQDYLNAKINYTKAVAELNKARQVAQITGGKSSSYNIVAPISGYITEKTINNNSEIRADNNANLFVIADLSRVWVTANVYESDINSIHLGDSATVNTLANPGKEYLGRIDKIYNVLDPSTRAMKVRITLSNPTNELKPEMFARVKVNEKPSAKMAAIPSQAVVLDNNKYYVVVRKPNKLEVKEINVIKRIENQAFITGLEPNDQVVTNSQVFLYQALTNN